MQPIHAFTLLPPRSIVRVVVSSSMLVSHHSLKLVRTAHGAHDAHLSHVPPSTRAPKAACVSNRIFHAPKPHHSYKYTVKLAAATTNRAISESTSIAREMEEEKVAAAAAAAAAVVVDNAARLRSDFLEVLHSRRSPEVPLTLEQAKPVANPLYQDNTGPQTISEAMESCPRADIKNLKDVMREENFYLTTEEGEQGRLPVLTLSLKDGKERKPSVVFLHSTNKCKEWLRPLLEAYASRGYVAIAVDSRYHGERASNKTTYRDALISSWKRGDTMPFIFDTVWDLTKLADYLMQREDIDPTRIGITGESLGGMHAWFAAFADTRYVVVVPIIGVQGFRWAIDNDMWQGRVDSLMPLFEEARMDLGKSAIDKEVVEKVWNQIAPGLASGFDSPDTIPAIATRPLLILNGAEDPRCPIAGLEVPKSRAHKAYEEGHCLEKFKLIAQPGIGHQMTPFMVKEASDWFDRFLKK